MTAAEAVDRWPGLTRRPAVAAAILVSAQGRVVEIDTLIERIFDETGGPARIPRVTIRARTRHMEGS